MCQLYSEIKNIFSEYVWLNCIDDDRSYLCLRLYVDYLCNKLVFAELNMLNFVLR